LGAAISFCLFPKAPFRSMAFRSVGPANQYKADAGRDGAVAHFAGPQWVACFDTHVHSCMAWEDLLEGCMSGSTRPRRESGKDSTRAGSCRSVGRVSGGRAVPKTCNNRKESVRSTPLQSLIARSSADCSYICAALPFAPRRQIALVLPSSRIHGCERAAVRRGCDRV
jgi:hypothetical protein